MRQPAGPARSTGVFQNYRDSEQPNQITVMLEWDNAENVVEIRVSYPALKEAM